MKEYNVDMQKLFLEMMIADGQAYIRVQNIYNENNFDKSLHAAAAFIKEHAQKHVSLPTIEQIQAVSGVTLKPLHDLDDTHYDWFMGEFESFTRMRELERAILKSVTLMEKGDFDPVEKLIKDAVQISLTKNMGLDYYDDPRTRLQRMKDRSNQVSTGWPQLDQKLYGGFGRGELNIFAGGSGSGKSLFLQNLAVNWSLAGLSGIYISLELSEDLCSLRIDSMLSNMSTKDVFKNIDDVELKVKMVGKKAGKLQVKEMPAQSNINAIRAYIKEYQIQTGRKVDFICVDYLDLLMPVSAKVSPNDLFVKDKYVSEELRNLAKEFKILLVTASQLNRGAVEEIEFDHSHIAGGISKINTADNVFGIYTSRAMREKGRYQLQLMKTRSSSGVGQKIDLVFNQDSLRITDEGTEAENPAFKPGTPNILSQIRSQGNTVKAEDADGPNVKAQVQSHKLKEMLAGLKK